MGSKGYKVGAHVVYKLQVHLVFVTKYRREMKRGGDMAGTTLEGSTDFISKPGIPVFVFIDRYVVAYRVTQKGMN